MQGKGDHPPFCGQTSAARDMPSSRGAPGNVAGKGDERPEEQKLKASQRINIFDTGL
jgi:hypothetical protein